MGLVDDVKGQTIAVDSSAFIYWIQEHPAYLSIIEPLFERADSGRFVLVTSAITLLETLVVPMRNGDKKLAEHYEGILTHGRGIRLVDVTRSQLKLAADIRAASSARTPDALQIAAALATGCSTLVTNDQRMPSVGGVRVVRLSNYL